MIKGREQESVGRASSCNTGVTPVREKREGGWKSLRPQSSPDSPSWANRKLLSRAAQMKTLLANRNVLALVPLWAPGEVQPGMTSMMDPKVQHLDAVS